MATDKQLKKAATELNDVMGLTPAINVKGDVDVLTKGIKAAMKHITPEDEFSETTQEVIDEFTAKPAKAAAAPAAKKKAVVVEDDDDDDDDDEPEVPAKKGKKAPVVVEDDDDDDDEPEVPAKKKKAAPAPEPPAKKKAAPVVVEDDDDDDDDSEASLEDQIAEGSLEELKALVKSNPIFKSLKKELPNYAKAGKLRKDMTALLPDDDDDDDEPVTKKKGAAAPAEKKEKAKAFVRAEYNRIDCLMIVLKTKKPKTIQDWIDKADDLFVSKSGGKSNKLQVMHLIKNYGKSLSYLGLDEIGIKLPAK